LINIVPARPPEVNTLTPTANWMHIAKEVLEESLFDFSPSGLRPEYSFFTKPIKYKDTEVVQVFYGNWTAHWQMSWHGEEEYDQQERYGDLSEKILISLDVETGGRKVPRIAKLQRHILDSIADTAMELLPDAQVRLIEHHLVWEGVDFNPYDNDSICEAAERLSTYIKALAVPVVEAALEWSNTTGFEMQSMRPLMRAS
jgi:hypothetical protein